MINYTKLQDALHEAEKEIFKALSYRSAIEKEILEIIRDKAISRFSKRIIYKNNLRYILYDVNASLYGCKDFYDLPNVTIGFIYVLESPNKKQSEKLEEFKTQFKMSKYVPYSKSRSPIFFEVNYDITIESALLANYNIVNIH